MENKDKSTEEREITLSELLNIIKDWIHYLIQKSKWILLSAGIMAMAGFAYFTFKPVNYTAKSSFVLEESGGMSNLAGLGGLASMVGLDVGGGGGLFTGDNILELYKSRNMLQKTLLSPQDNSVGGNGLLIEQYLEVNKLKSKLSEVDWDQVDFKNKNTVLQDSIIGVVIKKIREKELNVSKIDKKLSIIQVSLKSKNQIFAKQFSERLVEVVNNFYIQTRTKRSSQNVEILQSKTDSVRNVMQGAIVTAAVASDVTPNINPIRSSKRVVPLQQSQFSAEANKAVLTELLKNLELSKITLLKETPLIQIIDMPILPLENDKGKVWFNMAIGFFLGLFGGVSYFILRRLMKSI